MTQNDVSLVGTVKRDAEAVQLPSGARVLDFALVVHRDDIDRDDIFDCKLTDQSEAFGQLEGYVQEGERLEVVGHLEKHTRTDSQRVCGSIVEVRTTGVVVYVDGIIKEES